MDMRQLMSQAKKAQAELEKSKKILAKQEFITTKQGLKLVMTGDRKLQKIEIDEILIDPEDKELLEDILIIALNESLEKVQDAEEALMPKG